MRTSHAATLTGAAALLGSLVLIGAALPVAAKAPCTYRMAVDMPGYDPTGATINIYPLNKGWVEASEVVCGGPGRDEVSDVVGTFRGRSGDDIVGVVRGDGVALLGKGADHLDVVYGKVHAGAGPDVVEKILVDAIVNTGRGADTLGTAGYEVGRIGVMSASFGGPGDDTFQFVGTGARFVGGRGDDHVEKLGYGLSPAVVEADEPSAYFYAGEGDDSVGLQSAGFYRGGRGSDAVDAVCGGTQANDVERVTPGSECPR